MVASRDSIRIATQAGMGTDTASMGAARVTTAETIRTLSASGSEEGSQVAVFPQAPREHPVHHVRDSSQQECGKGQSEPAVEDANDDRRREQQAKNRELVG